jgi:hypothetical protein
MSAPRCLDLSRYCQCDSPLYWDGCYTQDARLSIAKGSPAARWEDVLFAVLGKSNMTPTLPPILEMCAEKVGTESRRHLRVGGRV